MASALGPKLSWGLSEVEKEGEWCHRVGLKDRKTLNITGLRVFPVGNALRGSERARGLGRRHSSWVVNQNSLLVSEACSSLSYLLRCSPGPWRHVVSSAALADNIPHRSCACKLQSMNCR